MNINFFICFVTLSSVIFVTCHDENLTLNQTHESIRDHMLRTILAPNAPTNQVYYADRNDVPKNDSNSPFNQPLAIYPINSTININPRDKSTCKNSPNPDRGSLRDVGYGSFHFNMTFKDQYAGQDYYMGLALGVNNMKETGHYFTFSGSCGYMGYRPIGLDEQGRQKLQLIYSTLSPLASVVNNEHCTNDGVGPPDGVSCKIEYSYIDYEKLYYIHTIYDQISYTCTGYFIDPYKKNVIQIGSFKYSQPINWQQNTYGFLDTYHKRRIPTCCDLKPMNIFVVCPFGKGLSCETGSINEYGSSCINEYSDFQTKSVSNIQMFWGLEKSIENGLYIHRGWE